MSRMADTSEWSCRANRTQSALRAVGGHLVLEGGRLEFRPHGFDRALSGKGWSTPLSAVRSVGTEPRGLNPFSGALRERLRIETEDGGVELFVVNKLGEVRERIEAERAAAAGGP
jgi:hypothetical protein